MFNYGNMLYKGDGIIVNKQDAARYFKMSAYVGNIKTMLNYGILLINFYYQTKKLMLIVGL